MLKGIPPILSPELLKIMMEMGHGDELVIADGNFPSEACGKRVVRLDGHGVPQILDAILQFFPLDIYVDAPISLMQTVAGDPAPEIWGDFETIVKTYDPNACFGQVERFAFYEQAKQAYAVVATGETAIYANIILKKGVVK
jgi:L-fucose mutarotase